MAEETKRTGIRVDSRPEAELELELELLLDRARMLIACAMTAAGSASLAWEAGVQLISLR